MVDLNRMLQTLSNGLGKDRFEAILEGRPTPGTPPHVTNPV